MTPIDDKYNLLGGNQGFLGAPTTPELPTPNGLGSYRHYQNGSIYWNHAKPEAFEVHGLIRQRWAEMGWENSLLGFPTSDEDPAGGGRGRANSFERGVISWSPATGAHEVYGLILTRWLELRREDDMGFPLTGELPTPDGRGRYNHFENGSIYYTPQTGAHEVRGNIKNAWALAGWEQGPLGYPAGVQTSMPGSTTSFQDFERGSMYENLNNVRTVLRSTAIVTLPGMSVRWSDLGSPMADGDTIAASFVGGLPGLMISITLNAGPGITWWKGVSLWSPTQGDLFEATTENGRTTATITFPAAAAEPSNRFLVFKKAKAFGVRTGMYWLGRVDRLIGNRLTLTWLGD